MKNNNSNSTLTEDDLKNAFNNLLENDKEENEARYKRRLKDYSKLKDFYEAIKTLKYEEQIILAETVGRLAEGYFLVMNKTMYDLTVKELKKYKVPKEVLNNIYISKNLITKK